MATVNAGHQSSENAAEVSTQSSTPVDHPAPTISVDHLEDAREQALVWRERCDALEGLTDGERDEVYRAVLFAALRFSSYYFATRRLRRPTTVLLTLMLYALIWLAEEGIAVATLHRYIALPLLFIVVWAGAATGWILISFDLETVTALVKAVLQGRWSELRDSNKWVMLGSIGLLIVASQVAYACVRHDERSVLLLGAIMLGSLGGLSAPRINRVAKNTAHRALGLQNGRVRPHDDLLTDLVYIASLAAWALHGRSPDSWRNRIFVRNYAELLARTAANIERAPGLSRTLRWWQFRLKASVAEPYITVAAVVRLHREKAFATSDATQWRVISGSLASGALAAARHDWPALTEVAPNSRLVPTGSLTLVARRLGTPFLLAACAIALPYLFDLGVYGPSLRSILSVSAALALLPGDSQAASVVRETLAKTQTWRQ